MRRIGTIILSACAVRAASCSTPPINCQSPMQVFRDLTNSLSSDAGVFFPGSDEFQAATTRWSELDTPTVDIIVSPATEEDVARTVQQANECGLAVLAFNGVHGAITTLGRMKRGVGIHLGRLSNVTVAQDGETAIIAGGAVSKAVIDTLWEAGKQTVTGTCECVSYLGPALGGGHGWLQGRLGLIADQSVSMNVVLPNGGMQTIDSSSDLFWAMKGAGQNFGIVTSVTVKVYDIVHSDWAIETLIFTGDKVEAVYEAANRHLSNLPVDVINWSYWLNMPDVDPDKPVILFYIIQEGVTAVDPTYTAPFHDIGPVTSEAKAGTYRDLASWTGISTDSPPCQKAGLANPRFPMYVRAHDVGAQRAAYDAFAAGVGARSGNGNGSASGSSSSSPSPFAQSIFMFEAYPQQGVRAVDGSATAFAFRGHADILAAPLLTYAPAGPARDAEAARLGNRLRDILRRGRGGAPEVRAYVNYAFGDEAPVNWYGAEPWRQSRLRALKRKYDPEGRFGFFAPIGQGG
ncbi:putative FAD-dependent oxygenase [Rosellinia necatrix]|uniref:Putative FAD-dependent oxygenase n=1 Tax=Rosellinia necatrix TaxID=77044 RepID=A0A1W2TXE6_ROSNE|nr:putative FAD-dependent oxygenase [Rosellinia necatrix]